MFKDAKPVGRFAYYENTELKYKNMHTACIGSYECEDDALSGSKLLNHAMVISLKKGYKCLIGPMEGSIWENYRFSEHNEHPNFFMEPYHHTYFNDHFKQSGFEPISRYLTNLDLSMNFDEEELKFDETRFTGQGAVFRTINMNNLENDISKIAEFSTKAFSNNFLYTSINKDDFKRKFLGMSSFFDPETILMVEDTKGILQGMCFSIKDFNDPSGKTLVAKSLARLPDSPFKGIGAYLGGKTVQIAKEAGYQRMLHAFLITDNASRKISETYSGDAYKSYSLYGLKL